MPAQSNAGSRRRVKVGEIESDFMRSARRTPPGSDRKGGTKTRCPVYRTRALFGAGISHIGLRLTTVCHDRQRAGGSPQEKMRVGAPGVIKPAGPLW